MIEEAHLDELLQIVGDVGAEIVAARASSPAVSSLSPML